MTQHMLSACPSVQRAGPGLLKEPRLVVVSVPGCDWQERAWAAGSVAAEPFDEDIS